ncbi:MAG: membrane protein insertion efficiency factor YidD [Oleibacter sp.]|nr:membrane protein insertion efficiency factor YidD [Thalassolituus sp.]
MQEKNVKSAASIVVYPILFLITIYRYAISPLLPSRCRFYPTCSSYADEAFRRHGLFHGGKLTIIRLGKCHPWGGHGVDLVPESQPHSSSHHCCQRKT